MKKGNRVEVWVNGMLDVALFPEREPATAAEQRRSRRREQKMGTQQR